MGQIFSERTRRKIKGNLSTYTQSLISRNPFPVWAYIFMTRDCNLACSYCYVTKTKFEEMGIKGASDDMNIDELKQAVDKLWGLGTRYVSFFGGEPTIRRRELVEIVRYASFDKSMFTQLPTNGTLLKHEGYINDLGRAGIDLIDVSLDSLARFDESRKDMYHRESLFDNLLEGREQHGFAIKTNYVITPKNPEQLEGILEFGKNNGIIVSIRLAMKPPITPPNWTEPQGIYFSSGGEDTQLIDDLANKIIEKKKEGYAVSEPVEFYEAMKKWIRGEKDFWKCDAGRYHLTINNNGMVMQCALLTDDLGLHFRELDRDFAKKLQRQVDENLARCNDNCLAAAYFCGQHYRRHPQSLFRQGFLAIK